MANCQKNSNYLFLDADTQQIRNIALSSDGKGLEINLEPSGTNECTFNIDNIGYTGLKINGGNFQIVDPISGLNNQISQDAGKAKVKIEKDGSGVLRIIGVSDIVMDLEANIRYDAESDKVYMEY